ncbi:MAG: DoxX family protein [Bacteroidales bacterium]|nr:DoxX family protein [Bacteroidales bacterium]
MKYLRLLSRVVVGVVFIFSGFVKALDPLGSAYKFADYFMAFKLGFLDFLTLPLGIFLSAFELVLGITLLLGYRRKTMYQVLMWFMSFFTLLTLILAIFNPVSDCGCFGDALILTNWQTFFKNVVLMVFVLFLYVSRKADAGGGPAVGEWIVVGSFFVMASAFSVWNYRHLPLIDFRPYDAGTVIGEEMKIPEGVAVDEYSTTLIYRNRATGKEDSFTMENYPKDTAQWEFVTSESKLVKRGYEPPIHDFAILDDYGNDLVDAILADREYSMIMLSYDLSAADEQALFRAGEWFQLQSFAGDFSFYAVTASTTSEVERISAELGLGYPFLAGDDIMLKTIVRSNPGFMLVKNGTILAKWGYRDLPLLEQLYPQWTELLGNASAPQDEETQMMMESGLLDGFSFDLVEFEQFTPELLWKDGADRRERGVSLAFVLALLLLMFISGQFYPVKL